MRLSLLLVLMLFSGCTMYTSYAMNYVGAKWTKEITGYCAMPIYRRYAVWNLANGPLPEDMSIEIHCPGDE